MVQQYQYSTHIFIIPKKLGTVRFITYYLRLDQKLARKPYPSPRIGNTMHHMEGFQYDTTLDLNMRYYTTRILTASQDMMTIVTEFGKFMYNRLPTGMCALGDIFQARLDKILGDIKGIKTYIDDTIVLSKEI